MVPRRRRRRLRRALVDGRGSVTLLPRDDESPSLLPNHRPGRKILRYSYKKRKTASVYADISTQQKIKHDATSRPCIETSLDLFFLLLLLPSSLASLFVCVCWRSVFVFGTAFLFLFTPSILPSLSFACVSPTRVIPPVSTYSVLPSRVLFDTENELAS